MVTSPRLGVKRNQHLCFETTLVIVSCKELLKARQAETFGEEDDTPTEAGAVEGKEEKAFEYHRWATGIQNQHSRVGRGPRLWLPTFRLFWSGYGLDLEVRSGLRFDWTCSIQKSSLRQMSYAE